MASEISLLPIPHKELAFLAKVAVTLRALVALTSGIIASGDKSVLIGIFSRASRC